MKRLLLIVILSLSFVLSILVLNTTTHATTDIGKISIVILTGNSTCVYGTSMIFNDHWANFNSFSETGIFTQSTWSCTDLVGVDSWVLSVVSSDLHNKYTHTIPARNIKIIAGPNSMTQGNCTPGVNTTSWTSIDTPQTILQKLSGSGQICTIAAPNVQLSIFVSGTQALGLYTGTLTVTLPTGF